MTQENNKIDGKIIKGAYSSLTNFSCEFADGTGLLLEAVDPQAPRLAVQVVEASALPREMDAVCKVDWSWIVGSNVAASKISQQAAQFQLDKAGPLTISVQVWQGKPFLAFQPFRPAP